jgi:putative endonuclease
MGTPSNQAGHLKRPFITPAHLIWKLTDAARQFRQRQTLTPEMALGRRGEDLAHRYLQRIGYRVIARNYRPGGGEAEIDIVARHAEIVVFVEVKARSSAEFGSPDRAIGSAKRKNIVLAAHSYATRAGIEWDQVRFDTISIVFNPSPAIMHHQDAFFER